MQLYALNQDAEVICATRAVKHQDYFCPECGDFVRVRGGIQRRNHFFHFHPAQKCRQSQKSLVHLQVQQKLSAILPLDESDLEHRFPSIQRVADVVWKPQKLIFEVQCSAIYAEEILARNRDYASLGYQVVWILHDKRYNKSRMTAAEQVLEHLPHYFTNIDSKGRGCIYDQFALFVHGIRKHRQKPLAINPSLPMAITEQKIQGQLPKKLHSRMKTWPVFFSGDLIFRSIYVFEEVRHYLREACLAESHLEPKRPTHWLRWIHKWISRPYKLVFQMLLERACR